MEEIIKQIKLLFTKIAKLFISEKEIEIEKGGGLLGIGEKETDYLLGGSLYNELLKKKAINRQVVYEYNQGAEYETRNWCTIYSAITQLSYLMDYKFADCEIKEIGHKMIANKKLDPNNGAYLSDAIDYVRNYWNKTYPNKKISSYRIDYLDSRVNDLLKGEKLRMTQMGYMTSGELFEDIQDDGIASKSDYPKVGGHAVSRWGVWTIDNYKGEIKHNRYNFTKFNDLVKNGVIFRNGYVFLKDGE